MTRFYFICMLLAAAAFVSVILVMDSRGPSAVAVEFVTIVRRRPAEGVAILATIGLVSATALLASRLAMRSTKSDQVRKYLGTLLCVVVAAVVAIIVSQFLLFTAVI